MLKIFIKSFKSKIRFFLNRSYGRFVSYRWNNSPGWKVPSKLRCNAFFQLNLTIPLKRCKMYNFHAKTQDKGWFMFWHVWICRVFRPFSGCSRNLWKMQSYHILLLKVLLRVPTENSFVSVCWISIIIINSRRRSYQLSLIAGRKPVSPSLGMF